MREETLICVLKGKDKLLVRTETNSFTLRNTLGSVQWKPQEIIRFTNDKNTSICILPNW